MASIACPQCPKVFATEDRMLRHQRMAPDHTAPPPKAKAAAPSKPAVSPQAVLAKAVENLQTAGTILAGTIAPHVGVAIAGTKDGTVPSRAVMAGHLLQERVEKDAQLVKLLMLWNRLWEVPEGLELGAGMVAAVALDTGRVSPDWQVATPIGVFQPVRLAIGDVVDYVAEHSEPAPGASPNGAEPASTPQGVEAT